MILTGVSTGHGAEAVLEQGEERGEQAGREGDTEGHLLSRIQKLYLFISTSFRIALGGN